MSPSELVKYIEEPKLLNENSIIDITLLAEKYPFFQTIQLLRIKNLHNLDPGSIKHALNYTAAYVSDRKILYYLLHPIGQKEQPQTITEEHKTEPKNFNVSLPGKEVKETIRENIADTLTNQQNFMDSNQDTEIEFSTTMDVVKEYGEGIELEDFVVRINKDEDAFLELIEDEKKITPEDREITLNNEKSVDPENIDILTIINKGLLPEDINPFQSNLSDSQKKKNVLIDNFIKSNPKIEPINQSIPNNPDISSDSVKENDHLITDTLANIYLKQGHYAKAIFAYEKLSLKYPEKSAYFARQIAEIKKLIEKNKD
jgi:tetratricopeptide (TPR) repeat protein